jgi:hypothetical protein
MYIGQVTSSLPHIRYLVSRISYIEETTLLTLVPVGPGAERLAKIHISSSDDGELRLGRESLRPLPPHLCDSMMSLEHVRFFNRGSLIYMQRLQRLHGLLGVNSKALAPEQVVELSPGDFIHLLGRTNLINYQLRLIGTELDLFLAEEVEEKLRSAQAKQSEFALVDMMVEDIEHLLAAWIQQSQEDIEQWNMARSDSYNDRCDREDAIAQAQSAEAWFLQEIETQEERARADQLAAYEAQLRVKQLAREELVALRYAQPYATHTDDGLLYATTSVAPSEPLGVLPKKRKVREPLLLILSSISPPEPHLHCLSTDYCGLGWRRGYTD